MDLKETYQNLVQRIQNYHRGNGKKISKELIAQKLGLTRTYFSGLLGGSAEIKQFHIDDLKLKFRDELEGKPLPTHEDPPWTMKEEAAVYGQKSTTERLLAIIEQQSATILSQQQTIQSLIATQGNASSPLIASM